jgi:hypothetical protein
MKLSRARKQRRWYVDILSKVDNFVNKELYINIISFLILARRQLVKL